MTKTFQQFKGRLHQELLRKAPGLAVSSSDERLRQVGRILDRIIPEAIRENQTISLLERAAVWEKISKSAILSPDRKNYLKDILYKVKLTPEASTGIRWKMPATIGLTAAAAAAGICLWVSKTSKPASQSHPPVPGEVRSR